MHDVPGTCNVAYLMETFLVDEHSNAGGGIFIRKAYFENLFRYFSNRHELYTDRYLSDYILISANCCYYVGNSPEASTVNILVYFR